MKRSELRLALGLKHEEHFRKSYLLPALKAGRIEMTLPDKPRSSKQRYRITLQGEEILKKHKGDDTGGTRSSRTRRL
jgi:ATP-dependent DNA helicase RecG